MTALVVATSSAAIAAGTTATTVAALTTGTTVGVDVVVTSTGATALGNVLVVLVVATSCAIPVVVEAVPFFARFGTARVAGVVAAEATTVAVGIPPARSVDGAGVIATATGATVTSSASSSTVAAFTATTTSGVNLAAGFVDDGDV